MKRSFLLFVVLIFTGVTFLEFPSTWAAELNYKINRDVTRNGIEVFSVVDPTTPTVSFQVFVRAGSRDEVLPNRTGLAHIFEHLMFRGTPRFPKYDEAILHTGAENNADTSNDRTRYFEHVKAEHLEHIIKVEADHFKNLKFDRTAFNNELGPVRQEREKGVDNNPAGFLSEKLMELAYTKHTYRHDTIGTKEDIINMKYDDAYDFYNTFYRPENIFIVMVGNLDRAKAFKTIDKEFGGSWGRQPYAGYEKKPEVEPPQTAARRATFTWKDSLTPALLRVAYHIPPMRLENTDFCALELTEKLLFLQSSPLTHRLVQQLELVQPGGFGGGAWRQKDPSVYVISATMRQGKGAKAVAQVEAEINLALQKLAKRPISKAEIAKAINNHVAGLFYSLARSGDIAQTIGETYIMTGDVEAINKLAGCYRQVTARDIQRVAATYLVPSNRTTVTLLPKGGAK